jgi:hypothetical protein
MCKLQVRAEWQEKFQVHELASLDAVLNLEPEKLEEYCLPCGVETFKLAGEPGFLCLKREKKISCSRILHDLLKFKFPQTRTTRERKAIILLRRAGFLVPQIVAWGEKRCLGLPRAGALIVQPLPGQNLPCFLAAELDADARRRVVEKAEATLLAMHSMGFFWPDCRAENFLVLSDGEISLLNLDSVRQYKTLDQEECQQQFEIFYGSLFD